VVQPHDAAHAQLARAVIKAGDADAVAEHIMQPADLRWRGLDVEPCLDDPLVMAFAGAQQHPMLAEGDRLPVAVGRQVADIEDGDDGISMGQARYACATGRAHRPAIHPGRTIDQDNVLFAAGAAGSPTISLCCTTRSWPSTRCFTRYSRSSPSLGRSRSIA
jgi:hypothetical protein